jgi:hypothetical protein
MVPVGSETWVGGPADGPLRGPPRRLARSDPNAEVQSLGYPSSANRGHQHGLHHHGTGGSTADLQVRRYLFGAVLAFGVLAVIGVAVWWPRGDAPQLYGENGAPQFVDATVDTAEQTECPGLEFDFPVPCQQLEVTVSSGPNAGDVVPISIYPDQQDVPILHDGDQIVLASFQAPGQEANYAYADLQRSTQLWVLVAAFAGTILLFGDGTDCGRSPAWA